jgi:hypothetical protein
VGDLWISDGVVYAWGKGIVNRGERVLWPSTERRGSKRVLGSFWAERLFSASALGGTCSVQLLTLRRPVLSRPYNL